MENLKIILEHLLPVVVLVITPFIMWFVHRGLAYLEKQYGLKMDEKTYRSFCRIISDGIHYAEESGLKALKSGKGLESRTKMGMAMEFIMAEMKRNKLPEIAGDQLKKLVESKLFSDRPSYSPEVLGE